MPRLPDVNDLGGARPVAQQQGVVRIDGQQIGQALESTGDRMSNLGLRIQEREDRMNYAKANAKFTQDMINLDSQFDQDQDYKTFGQRYQEGVKKIKSEASSMINNRSLRESFDLNADTEITRGFDRLAQKAWAKERDTGIASLNDVIAMNRENALRAGDDVTAMKSLDDTRMAIQLARENGYLDETHAQQIQQKTAVDYATAKLSMMPPNARIAALKGSKASGPLFVVGKPAGMLEAGNINLSARPVVKNPDGSISTVNSMSFQDVEGGPEILIPTVIGDRVVSPKEAIAHYKKTGEHLGKFKTPEEATAYAQKLHEQQDSMYSRGNMYDVIPADQKAALLDAAEKEQRVEYLKTVGVSEAEKLSSKYATLGEAMAANNASDPEVRSRIDSELRRTYAIREDARLAARKQTFSTIEENLIANKGDISALDTKLFSSLDGADYLRIKTFADKVAEGGFIANDWKSINKLTDMAKNDPAAFAKEDLTQYIDKMDGTYRKKFETAQEKAKANESDPEISQLYSMGAQIGKTLDILLPKPGKSESQSTKTAYNVKRGEFERILRDKVNDFEVQSGRKANEAERQQIIDDFTRDVVSKKEHWFWPDTEEKVNITSVPPEYVREISAKLAASGRAVTPENIIATYEIRKKAGLIK